MKGYLMGIFSTVAEVAKNKQNFKNWEEQQKLEQSKRQQLYQNKHYSQKEIENARALGTTIIDAIDVMDNHSESVAENVETATEPLVFMAPFLGTIAGTIGAFKFAFNPAFLAFLREMMYNKLTALSSIGESRKKPSRNIIHSFVRKSKVF